jgi:hypothetical protein
MMKLTEDEEQMLDSCCSLCLEPARLPTGEYRWCASHQHRGELLAWGMAHGYPALDGGTYNVARGAYHWTIAATLGTDDMIFVLLGIIELLEDKPA